MTKYLIKWDAGYGEDVVVEEHENNEAAEKSAYEHWREAVENNSDYSATVLTRELAEDNGLEDELDESE